VEWWPNEGPYLYRVFGTGYTFEWHAVLNHRVGHQGHVRPGVPMEGFLLGTCSTPVPWEKFEGIPLPATLAILDEADNVHFAEISLRYDKELDVKFVRPQSSLYGQARQESGHSPRVGAKEDAGESAPASAVPRRSNLPVWSGRMPNSR